MMKNGYSLRSANWDDLPAAVEVMNAAARQMIGRNEFTVQDYEVQWKSPLFNLADDTRVAVAPDGSLAGYYEVWDNRNPPARIVCWGRIHPEHEGQGLGSALLAWAEQRARQAIRRAPEDIQIVLHAYIPHVKSGAEILLADHEFDLIRHSLRMVIDLDQSPAAPKWPQGIRVQSMRPGDEEEVVRTIQASFRDHWGHVETPFEEDLERFMQTIRDDPVFDAGLFFLALDGEQIVGVSLCWDNVYDDPDMGWVGTLGVRREYRRCGLGQALLLHSLGEFYRRGKPRAGLGVDAGSLTGATRLYEKVGMRADPVHQYDLYEKILRAGINITTQVIEAVAVSD